MFFKALIFFHVIRVPIPDNNEWRYKTGESIMKNKKNWIYLCGLGLMVFTIYSHGFAATRPTPQSNVLENVAILHLNISKFFFRTGEKLFFKAYVENRNSHSLPNAKVSLYVHKQGKRAVFPVKVIQQAILHGAKISIFEFDIIWDETGYNTSYNYKHGDYQFELVVEHNNKSVSKTHVLWAKPHEYMFYWDRPY